MSPVAASEREQAFGVQVVARALGGVERWRRVADRDIEQPRARVVGRRVPHRAPAGSPAVGVAGGVGALADEITAQRGAPRGGVGRSSPPAALFGEGMVYRRQAKVPSRARNALTRPRTPNSAPEVPTITRLSTTSGAMVTLYPNAAESTIAVQAGTPVAASSAMSFASSVPRYTCPWPSDAPVRGSAAEQLSHGAMTEPPCGAVAAKVPGNDVADRGGEIHDPIGDEWRGLETSLLARPGADGEAMAEVPDGSAIDGSQLGPASIGVVAAV